MNNHVMESSLRLHDKTDSILISRRPPSI